MDYLEKLKIPVYSFLIFFIYTSYFLAFFGIYNVKPELVNDFRYAITFFICMFLIIRFNPFQTHELRYFDDKLIFGSGLILLSNLGFELYLSKIEDKSRSFIKNILNISQ